MRVFSPINLLLFIVIWSAAFLLIARYFLFSAHQSWFKDEEQNLLASVEMKIDNLDARNMRQLNQLYEEVKKLQGMLSRRPEQVARNVSVPSPAVSPAHGIEQTIAILVIACNRVDYIKQTLDELLKHRPSAGLFPIIVSQDCGDQPTANVIASYGTRITHLKHPNLSDIQIPMKDRKLKNKVSEVGYYKISRHFKWALTQVFEELRYDHVVIVEDDIIIAPDFYMYFSALWRLLNSDPSIMCISAYADNGKDNGKIRYFNLQQNDMLYRTDFFPGLGWMLNKKLWLELKPKWPLAFWDDWLRLPEQMKERVCIRPEVSRTKTIGKKGVSVGADYTKHLQHIYLNKDPVDFTKMNLTYLKKEAYDKTFVVKVQQLPLSSVNDVLQGSVTHEEVRVQYSSNKEFESLAKRLEIMSDLRSGVPRTAYKGIVTFMYRNKRIYLVPTLPWSGYRT